MELRTLRTFQRVAQLKSFSKAAAALGYTQAAVTIQIQQLEKSCTPVCLTVSARRFRLRSREIYFMTMPAASSMKVKKPSLHCRKHRSWRDICASA